MSERELAETTQLKRPTSVSSTERSAKSKFSQRIAVVLGSAPSMSEESARRLAERLRTAALLMGSGFAVYLVLKLFGLFQSTDEPHPILFWGHLLVTVAMLGIAWRLCAKCPIALRYLRVAEEDLTLDGSITGSPLYLSPEQALGENPETRSDIYSLGAVAYYLLTGRPPFQNDNPMHVIMAHARDVPERPSKLNADISPGLEMVIMKCLEKLPSDRFANVRELQRAFAACETESVWSSDDAVTWWKDHGCPHKKRLDAEVLELTTA